MELNVEQSQILPTWRASTGLEVKRSLTIAVAVAVALGVLAGDVVLAVGGAQSGGVVGSLTHTAISRLKLGVVLGTVYAVSISILGILAKGVRSVMGKAAPTQQTTHRAVVISALATISLVAATPIASSPPR